VQEADRKAREADEAFIVDDEDEASGARGDRLQPDYDRERELDEAEER
jgi:hypothetical protein